MRRSFLLSIILAALLGAPLMGCEPTIANRGNILDPDKLAEVKVGTSTREEVAQKLGSPTEVSTFDDKVWYYVGRETEQYSFFMPDVLKQQAVEVRFDDQGVVTAVNMLDLSEAHDVASIDRKTPTYGQDNTFIQQLIGNLGHPSPNMNNKREGQ